MNGFLRPVALSGRSFSRIFASSGKTVTDGCRVFPEWRLNRLASRDPNATGMILGASRRPTTTPPSAQAPTVVPDAGGNERRDEDPPAAATG
jgi:hypothetical protein